METTKSSLARAFIDEGKGNRPPTFNNSHSQRRPGQARPEPGPPPTEQRWRARVRPAIRRGRSYHVCVGTHDNKNLED